MPTMIKPMETWANAAYVDGQFQKLKTTYADKGIPVIIGEYEYRNYWDQYITASAKRHGFAPLGQRLSGLSPVRVVQPQQGCPLLSHDDQSDRHRAGSAR